MTPEKSEQVLMSGALRAISLYQKGTKRTTPKVLTEIKTSNACSYILSYTEQRYLVVVFSPLGEDMSRAADETAKKVSSFFGQVPKIVKFFKSFSADNEFIVPIVAFSCTLY